MNFYYLAFVCIAAAHLTKKATLHYFTPQDINSINNEDPYELSYRMKESSKYVDMYYIIANNIGDENIRAELKKLMVRQPKENVHLDLVNLAIENFYSCTAKESPESRLFVLAAIISPIVIQNGQEYLNSLTKKLADKLKKTTDPINSKFFELYTLFYYFLNKYYCDALSSRAKKVFNKQNDKFNQMFLKIKKPNKKVNNDTYISKKVVKGFLYHILDYKECMPIEDPFIFQEKIRSKQ